MTTIMNLPTSLDLRATQEKRDESSTARIGLALVLGVLGSASCTSSTGTSPSASDVTLDASPTFKGNLTVAGKVTLPSSATSGRAIQVKVLAVPGGTAPNFVGNVGNTSGSTVTYTINGLVKGLYFIEMTVDQNGNGKFGDSGDFDGYFNGDGYGTVAPPALSQGGATQLPVPAPGGPDGGFTGDTGINFALGLVP